MLSESKDNSSDGKENQYTKKALEAMLSDLQGQGLMIAPATIERVNHFTETGCFFGVSQVEDAMEDIKAMTKNLHKGKLTAEEKQDLLERIDIRMKKLGDRIVNMKGSINNYKNKLINREFVFESGKQGIDSTNEFSQETVPAKAEEIESNALGQVTEVKKGALAVKRSWFSGIINKLEDSNNITAKLESFAARSDVQIAQGDEARNQADYIKQMIVSSAIG